MSERRRFDPLHWITALAVVVSVALVASTYSALSHTADEPMHVASGLEWLQEGTHRLKAENPPLAQVGASLGAWLDGLRLPADGAAFRRGVEVLYAGDDYVRTLTRARLGTLPFFLLAIGIVWHWTRRWGGDRASLIATAAFCTLPPVLGHAGLATTDVPFLATFLLALYALVLWLEAPTVQRSLLFGLGLGLVLITKFSALIFLPPVFLVVILVRLALGGRRGAAEASSDARRARGRGLGRRLALVLAAGAFVVWAGYRFTVGSLTDIAGAERLVRTCFPEEGSLGRRVADLVYRGTWPAPEALLGLLSLYAHILVGHPAYLFGEVSEHGFWYFYPAALGLKTPLTFACLGLIAAVGGVLGREPRRWQAVVPVACAVTVLAAAMPSTINIGVRHVLVVYPLLAIGTGLGVERLLRRQADRPGREHVLLLVTLVFFAQFGSAVDDHPDFVASFNVLAGDEPGELLLDSDLDWGQDVLQLAEFCEREDVQSLHIATFGSVRLCEHGLPPVQWLAPGEPVTGWIAISEMYFRDHWRLAYADACDRSRPIPWTEPGGYAWLEKHEPVARVGGSIRIYRVP